MVFFTCNTCKQSLNKTQIKRHLLECTNCLFTCINCQQIFNSKNFKLHLTCFDKTEQECGVVNYIDMAINKKLKKSTIFDLFDISTVSMNSSLLNKNPVEESEYCFTENFKPVIPSQSPNNSSVPMDTSFENKKPDKMQRLLDELEEEFEKQNAGKAEGKKEAPPRRSYKLSPINPTKRSIARRKILQIIPETPEKQNENSQKGEKDNSFEVVKQTPIGKISSENSILASKLSELLLQEEVKMDKILRKRKLNFSDDLREGIEEKRKK